MSLGKSNTGRKVKMIILLNFRQGMFLNALITQQCRSQYRLSAMIWGLVPDLEYDTAIKDN